MKSGVQRVNAYKVVSMIVLVIVAFLFLFPLYWIITGAFKTGADIYATTPAWIPSEWTMANWFSASVSATPIATCPRPSS